MNMTKMRSILGILIGLTALTGCDLYAEDRAIQAGFDRANQQQLELARKHFEVQVETAKIFSKTPEERLEAVDKAVAYQNYMTQRTFCTMDPSCQQIEIVSPAGSSSVIMR
jgi:hypothetical protein